MKPIIFLKKGFMQYPVKGLMKASYFVKSRFFKLSKICLLTFLFAIIIVFNQCSIFQSEEPEEGPEAPEETTVIWEVRGSKAEGSSYVMGVPYPQCFKGLHQADNFYKAVSECEKALVPYKRSEKRLIDELTGQVTMKGGQTLDSVLTKSEREEVQEFLKNTIGSSPEEFQDVPPLLLDRFIYSRARRCHKNTTFLKEVLKATQRNYKLKLFSVFERKDMKNRYERWLNYEDQKNVLLKTIRQYDEVRKQVKDMNFYFKAADHKKAAKAKKASYPLLQDHADLYIQSVNRKYAEAIVEQVKEGPTFTLAGIEHFTGENNILHRLEEAGLKVRPYDPQKQAEERREIERDKNR